MQTTLEDCGILIPQMQLQALLGVKKTSFYKMKKQEGFPRPIKHGDSRSGAVYYKKTDVIHWLEQM